MKSANYFFVLIVLSGLFWSCAEETFPVEDKFDATLKSTETYAYDLNISGDEEGATIIEQAHHFQVSELKRDSSTNWGIVYYYQPESGFSGNDSVKIETCTGGDGTTCGVLDTLKIVFQVVE